MSAVEEEGDKYLVGPLCESGQKCLNQRLIVAFRWDEGMQALLKEPLKRDPNGY